MTSTTTSTPVTLDTPAGTRVLVDSSPTTDPHEGYVHPSVADKEGTIAAGGDGRNLLVKFEGLEFEGLGSVTEQYIAPRHLTIVGDDDDTPEPLQHADRVGRLSIGRTDDGRHVWFYVIAALGEGHAYGVNLGTNSSHYSPDGEGFRFQTLTLDEHTNDPVSRLSPAMRDELAAFFRRTSPHLVPFIAGEAPGESVEEAHARGKREQRAEDMREFEAWKERATEVAHEYADRNELCGEFDRCMSAIGLPTRSRTYRVTYEVTLPRGNDPWEMDAEDLYSAAEDGVGSPITVEEI